MFVPLPLRMILSGMRDALTKRCFKRTLEVLTDICLFKWSKLKNRRLSILDRKLMFNIYSMLSRTILFLIERIGIYFFIEGNAWQLCISFRFESLFERYSIHETNNNELLNFKILSWHCIYKINHYNHYKSFYWKMIRVCMTCTIFW